MGHDDPFAALANQKSIIIDQQTLLLDACCKCFFGTCCIDFENVYDVYFPGEKHHVFTIKEHSSCIGRAFCNPNHDLTLKVQANGHYGNDEILEIHKPFKCCCAAICPLFMKEITVYRLKPEKKVIGYVRQPCMGGGVTPTLNMYDQQGGNLKGRVQGPTCCIGGCCSSKWNLYDANGKEHVSVKRGGFAEIGVIRANASNSDKYELTFEDATLSVDDRLMILSTTIFIDYLFFEGENNCLIVCCTCPPQIWCKLCEVYCCGSTIPFRLKCCIKEALEAGKMAATGV